jgi:hypothetical protein
MVEEEEGEEHLFLLHQEVAVEGEVEGEAFFLEDFFPP